MASAECGEVTVVRRLSRTGQYYDGQLVSVQLMTTRIYTAVSLSD